MPGNVAVVIVAGPTASGKSALALDLAGAFGGTVINADALQIYRDLRLLSARPSPDAEARVPHRLFGILDAAERGSAANWRALAVDEVAAAAQTGALPILVGGTGLYLRAFAEGLAPVPDIPEAKRQEAAALYKRLGGIGFRALLAERDGEAAARLAPGDRHRLQRAWEVVAATGEPLAAWQQRHKSRAAYRICTILLMPPRERLYAACDARFAAMIAAGGLAEASALAARNLPPDLPAMKAVGIPELLRHLRGQISLPEAVTAAQRATRHYAKRQTTWFRHQITPHVVLEAQYSPALLPRVHDFIGEFLRRDPR